MTTTNNTTLSQWLSKVKSTVQKNQRWLMAAIFVSCFTTLIYYNSHPQVKLHYYSAALCDCLNLRPACQLVCSRRDTSMGILMPVDMDDNATETTTITPDRTKLYPIDPYNTSEAEGENLMTNTEAVFAAQPTVGKSQSVDELSAKHSTQISNQSTPELISISNSNSTHADTQNSTQQPMQVSVKSETSLIIPTTTTATLSTTTTKPVLQSVIMPDGKPCDACLMGRQLITVQKGWICGQPRIGNKMFMLAPAIIAAYEHNATVVLVQNSKNAQNKSDCEWADWLRDIFQYFNSSAPLLPAEMMSDWWNYGEPGFTLYTSNYYKPEVNYTVAGYRQTWKYLQTESQQTAVRQAFKFTSRYRTFATNTIASVKAKFNSTDAVIVGVHMRIGDLVDKRRLDYGYVMAKPNFYKVAIEKAIQTINTTEIIFMVASDTMQEAKKMLTSSNLTSMYRVHFLHGSAFEDFATLTKCDHTIISGGTYGWWAAWLAGGKTFYHANFSKPDSSFAKGFSNENFYCPDWIPIYSEQPLPAANSTNPPDVILPNGENCTSCLTGKQLVTVQKGWLCSSPTIGDKMFMIAPAIVSTVQHNTTLVLVQQSEDCNWVKRLQDLFEVFHNQMPLIKYSLIEDWPNLAEHNASDLHPEVYVPNRNFTFSGYRQHWRYVESPAEIKAVRNDFRFTEKYIKYADSAITEAKERFSADDNAIIVGMHVTVEGLNFAHGQQMANLTFYRKAMQELNQTFSTKKLIFIIVSSKTESAKALLNDLSSSYNIYYPTNSSYPSWFMSEGLALLSHCHHVVTSGGSLGYWAGFLSGGKVVYYSEFAKPGTKFFQEFHNENFYRPEWVGIGDT